MKLGEIRRVVLIAAGLAVIGGASATHGAEPKGALRCVGGLAGPYPCRRVEQEARVDRGTLGSAANLLRSVVGWRDETSGREFALVAHPGAVAVVEVTDTEHPRSLGRLSPAAPGSVVDVVVYRQVAYVLLKPDGTSGTLEVFELDALLAADGDGNSFSAAAAFPAQVPGHLTVDEESGRLYLYSRTYSPPGQVIVLDLADPLAPQQLFDWRPATGGLQGLECFTYHGPETSLAGRQLCAAAGFPRHLRIYDVTADPSALLGLAIYPKSRWPWKVATTPDHRFVLLADSHDEHFHTLNTRTFVFDIRAPRAPALFARVDGPTRARDLALEIRGKFAFLANGREGLRIIDLRRVAEQRVKNFGLFDIDPETSSNDWFGAIALDVLPSGIVLLVDSRQGLYILRPTLPESPGEPARPR